MKNFNTDLFLKYDVLNKDNLNIMTGAISNLQANLF